MRDLILRDCRKRISQFHNMSDIEIYNWMCNNYACKDFQLIRECSFVIFRESR